MQGLRIGVACTCTYTRVRSSACCGREWKETSSVSVSWLQSDILWARVPQQGCQSKGYSDILTLPAPCSVEANSANKAGFRSGKET